MSPGTMLEEEETASGTRISSNVHLFEWTGSPIFLTALMSRSGISGPKKNDTKIEKSERPNRKQIFIHQTNDIHSPGERILLLRGITHRLIRGKMSMVSKIR
jgi:hypothetical protein